MGMGAMMSAQHKDDNNNVASGTALVYVVFGITALIVYHWLAEGEFSAVLTLSAVFQCLAFCLVGYRSFSSGSIRGISAKSLQIEAIAILCRLSSTVWLDGYLPSDSTGDYLYQVFDVLSLFLVLGLLRQVLQVQRSTYEEDVDVMPVAPLVTACLVLAGFLHADLDDRPIFDTLWMCGLFCACIGVVPQLWMMSRSQSAIPASTSHFVAAMAVGRMLSGLYMWEARGEITCDPLFGYFNHAAYTILGAHFVHLILLADFGYFYIKNVTTKGLDAPLELDQPSFWV